LSITITPKLLIKEINENIKGGGGKEELNPD